MIWLCAFLGSCLESHSSPSHCLPPAPPPQHRDTITAVYVLAIADFLHFPDISFLSETLLISSAKNDLSHTDFVYQRHSRITEVVVRHCECT